MILEDRSYSPIEVIEFAHKLATIESQSIINRTVKTTLRALGILKPTLNKAQAIKEAGSRRKVSNAIREGALRCVKKGRTIIINRDEFEEWLNKNQFDT